MLRYLLKRLLHTVVILLVVTALVFFLLNVMGNPVRLMLPETATEDQIQALTHALGLDQPVYVRYVKYMGNLLRGDFGYSWLYNAPALELVLERIPVTLKVSALALLFGVAMAVPLGVISALKRNTGIDLLATGLSVIGQAMPSFWLGIMLMLIVATRWRLLPVSGYESWKHLILPTITLGTGLAASLTRLTRSAMLEVIGQDYIRTARAKGLSHQAVIIKHALRNALIPVITMLGLQLGSLLGGAVITESVFAIPGMGRLAVQALNNLDYTVVQTVVMFSVLVIVGANLLVDLVYTLVDPRISYE
ncbi:MAG: ABC transporter permease [Symbiobacterium sp.]|uniref:ABC transporter permease n=1 Tax=Symbiobacterium sp. TaxID=1971213 RepID=UPI003464E3BC